MANRALSIARLLSSAALAAAALTLAGWAFNVYRFADWDADGIVQQPNSALGIALAATGVLCASFGKARATRVLAGIAAGIGLATLFEHLTHIDLRIDAVLLNHDWGSRALVAPGRMGVPGSGSLAILGLSTVLLTTRRWRGLARSGGLAAIAVAMLSIIGYLLGADVLFGVPRFTAIALQTSTMVLALGASLVASTPERRPMALLLDDSAAAMLFRRGLPFIIVIPVVLGWLSVNGQQQRLFDAAFGTAALILALVIMLAALLWSGASAVAAHERAIRESRDRFSTLFEKAAFPIAVSDLKNGAFVAVNEAFLQLFGYRREEVIGRNSYELGINRDWEARTRLREMIDRDGEVRNLELKLHTRSGEERIVLNTSTLVRIDGESHLLTNVQDITDRKAAEEAMRASAEALIVADRIKDEFLATLSHELRTPLTSIVGWSHLLLTGSLDAAQQRVALETIRSSAKAQAQLVEDVLDVSRIVTGKMRIDRQDTDLAQTIDAAIAAIRPAAEAKRIAIRTRLERTLPPFFVDPHRIQQVVWNLLSNAIKFSPELSEVEVILRAEQDVVVIEVSDRGPGIAPEFLPQLFKRFRQADSSARRTHAGLGIGLALTKDLIELHGGTISVDTQVGHGTRFTVRLPVPKSGVDDHPAASKPDGAADGLHGVRVLFVHDRYDARALISTMLKSQGADVIEADSVDTAMTTLESSSVDVVVTDLAMPARDGYDLLTAIKGDARHSKVPVLALSAQGRMEEQVRAADAGFDAFLRKPVEPHDLGAAIVRALGR